MKEFDLNIEKILEDWEVYHAIREIISNAIDEQILTNTPDIQILKTDDGCWHIIDFGRGLNYHHLTQNENEEKTHDSRLIGRFGVGLKDALATLYRHGVKVTISSRFGIITLKQSAKIGFDDIVTLHAQINEPKTKKQLNMVGTDFCLQGCKDDDIKKSMALFLRFSEAKTLEKTPYGDVVEKRADSADIFINGVKVAEEPNFLFSYNITSLNSQLKKSLNRERTNVGRSAYTPRVKDILKKCSSEVVIKALTDDLASFKTGTKHDEMAWNEIELHATIQLSKLNSKATFVTASDLEKKPSLIDEIKKSGLEPVVISTALSNKIDIYNSIPANKTKLRNSETYIAEEKSKFVPVPVNISTLNHAEISIYRLTEDILDLIDGKPDTVKTIEIVEQLYESDLFRGSAVGLWVKEDGKVLIKRDQLADIKSYAATLIHECAHASSNAGDVTREFESELTRLLGILAVKAL